MEEDLDKIAGTAKRVDWLRNFFYGHDGEPGLNELSADLGAIDAREVNTMRCLQKSKFESVATAHTCKRAKAKLVNWQTFQKA